MEFLKRIKDRSPEYDKKYYDMILEFTIEQGSSMGTSTEEERWKQGKYFSTRYEIYMYAALLGLKKNYRLPIPKGAPKTHFIAINSWQPAEIAEYVIMGILAKSNLDFNDLEEMEDSEVVAKISELRSLLEEYANGGFDLIRAKKEEDPRYFVDNENCFLDFIDS